MSDFFEEQFEDNFQTQLAGAKTPKQKIMKKNSEGEGQLTVDVYQTNDDIVIRSTIAGVTAKDIDISITNDMVTIKGARNPDENVKSSAFYYQELYWGPFSRSIILPEEVDADKAVASMKNGILTLKLPKMAKSRTKRVRIDG